MSDERDPLTAAREQVGRFLYHFAQLEQAVNAGIAKLFSLEPAATDILTANIAFVVKVHIVRSMVNHQSKDHAQEWRTAADELLKSILGLNDPDRQTVAHSRFEPQGIHGVSFKRTTARGELKYPPEDWDATKFEQKYRKLQSLTAELEILIDQLVPIVGKLDFSDPQDSASIALIL